MVHSESVWLKAEVPVCGMETNLPSARRCSLLSAKGRGSRLRDGNHTGEDQESSIQPGAKGRGSRLRDGNYTHFPLGFINFFKAKGRGSRLRDGNFCSVKKKTEISIG